MNLSQTIFFFEIILNYGKKKFRFANISLNAKKIKEFIKDLLFGIFIRIAFLHED